MNKFRIAFFKSNFEMGGIETVLHNTALALREYDFEVFAICGKYLGNHSWDNSKSVKIAEVLDENNSYSDKSLNNLLEFIEQNNINLLCFDYINANFISKIKAKSSIKIMFWMHSTPFFRVHHFESSCQLKARRSTKYRNPIYKLVFKILKSKIAFVEKLRYKKAINICDFVAILNKNDKDFLIRSLKLPKDKAEKIKVLINPIEINPNPKLDKEKLIAFLGRFESKSKRIERLVDIWRLIYKDLPDWRLELYGDGESFDMIKTESADLERFHLMGRTNKPNEVYDKAAIIALTSQYEGWGMVLAEGQNNACIPIAFDNVGGVKTVLGENDFAGVGVSAFDINEYAEKLKRLCLDDEYRKNLQANALIKRNEYLFEKNIATWLDIKDKALK